MISVLKRTLADYFNGLFGWILSALLLLACGATVILFNVTSATSSLANTLYTFSIVVSLAVPFVAANTFTASNARKETLWMRSLPIGGAGATAGRLTAAWLLLSVPTLLLLALPALTAGFTTSSKSMAYVAILGYQLLLTALLTVVSAISARFSRKLTAVLVGEGAVVTFWLLLPLISALVAVLPWIGLLLILTALLGVGAWFVFKRRSLKLGLCMLIPAAAATLLYLLWPPLFSKHFSNLLYALALQDRLQGFCAGHLDLPAAVVYLSVAAIGLFALLRTPVSFGKKGGTRK